MLFKWTAIVFPVREKSIFEKWTSIYLYIYTSKSQKSCVSTET